ncbi:MAG: hypothetical protein IK018_00315 [Lachnospiraceae bacterium]|nr:hypothetical protein [Lachnospiraceae bacterium]
MFKTLKMMLKLKKTYRINTILYILRQLPLVNRILPPSLTGHKILSAIVTLILIIWEITAIFAGKLIYYFGAIGYTRQLSDNIPSDVLFVQMLFILTIGGLFMNVDFLNYRKDKYYAMMIFKLNAKEYTFLDFCSSLVKIIVGTLPVAIYMGLLWNVPLWFLILIPFSVALGKFIYAAYVLSSFDRTGVVHYAGKSLISWFAALVIILAAIILPAFEIELPRELCMGGILILIPVGLLCVKKVLCYKDYLKINKFMLNQVDMDMAKAKNRGDNTITSSLDEGSLVTSNKKGFEFLNDIFVKRHKKILWKPAVNLTIMYLALALIINVGLAFLPNGRLACGNMIEKMIPYFVYIVCISNRGMYYTRALFINCDHSMLTFSFYKKRNNVLKLFIIRLREIVKINLLPAFALGLALASCVFMPGDIESVKKGLVIILTIVAESTVFSIHCLMLYYLFQPYNVNTEVKNVYYYIAIFLTYALLYVLMFQRIPALTFGLACLIFSVVYTVITCILVYNLAPKTFKLKD